MFNRGQAVRFETQFVVDSCCDCGILFAMDADFQQRRLSGGGGFIARRGTASTTRKPSNKNCDNNWRPRIENLRRWRESTMGFARSASAALRTFAVTWRTNISPKIIQRREHEWLDRKNLKGSRPASRSSTI